MEVNKSEAITPTSGGGKRSLGRQLADDQEGNDKPDDEQPRRDAFEVDGKLDGSISPKVQQMLNDLAAQLEPLRTDLQRSQARERELRDRIERHPYLPVLNRQGLEHELARVVGHIQGLGSAAFACISITNAEQIRREHGRDVWVVGECREEAEAKQNRDAEINVSHITSISFVHDPMVYLMRDSVWR